MTDQNAEHLEEKTQQPPADGPRSHDPRTAEEIFSVDDRLLVLERASVEYRRHLFNIEDLVINQMVALGVLEVVFAVFLAVTLWSQYKKAE